MSEITQPEKLNRQFEGFRHEDEPTGNWLQRVLYQPMQGFDAKSVMDKFTEMEEQRTRLDAGQ